MPQGNCTRGDVDKMSPNLSIGTKICKVCTVLILFLLMTGAIVASKISIVWLIGGNAFDDKPPETWYASLGLVLIAPEVFALIKVFWNTSFIKRTRTHQWPSRLAIFVGCMVSFAEASCFLVFTLEVAPRLPVQILLPLLSAVYAVSLSHGQIEYLKESIPHRHELGSGNADHEMPFDLNFTLSQKKPTISDHIDPRDKTNSFQNWKKVLRTVFSFSGIWASCAIAGIVALTAPLSWFQAICLPACICILSLCWHPRVQIYIVRSSDGSFMGRWKATCGYTLVKITVLFIGLSVVMMIRLKESNVLDALFFSKLRNGLLMCTQDNIAYLILAQIFSSFLVHVFGYVAATLSIPLCGITFPSVVATPTSVGLVFGLCNGVFGFNGFSPITCFQGDVGVWFACGLAGIIWLAPYIICGASLNRRSEIILKPFVELFIQPTWNGIFLDQHLSLNYKYDGFSSTDHILNEEEKPNTRVFICTTMYREADFEMKRLLKSIHKVATSKILKTVYLESHIFLDNGVTDIHLNDFARQLMSLLDKNLGVRARQANAYVTPYGVQLNWTLPGGMPFFIHLKDSAKIKDKKRWSQVMYMSYVLNFRVLQDHSRDKVTKLETEQTNTDDSLFVGYASDTEWKKNTVKLKRDGAVEHLCKTAVVTSPSLGCQTPLYLRDGRKHLKQMFRGSYDPAFTNPANLSQHTYEIIENVSSRSVSSDFPLRIHIPTPGASSDQGIGNSTSDDPDEMLSESSLKEDADSFRSSNASTRKTSKHDSDENWREYEADISSNNENSPTSRQTKHFAKIARDVISRKNSSFHDVPCPRTQPLGERGRKRHTQSLTQPKFGARDLIRLDSATRKLYHPALYNTEHRIRRHSTRGHTSSRRSHRVPRREQPERRLSPVRQQESSDSGTGQDNPTFDHPAIDIQSNRNKEHTMDQPHNEDEPSVFVLSSDNPDTDADIEIPFDEHSYILATDADMEFTDKSVEELLNLCHYDRRLGGACGRTQPIGQTTGPLVWYQKFEYAKGERPFLYGSVCIVLSWRVSGPTSVLKDLQSILTITKSTETTNDSAFPSLNAFSINIDFWMIKSAQNIIGSVMCCPGCFSLYRVGAVRDVLCYYAGPTSAPFDVFIKDSGEDRWMCTLMMLKGWKLEYTAFCDNATYCPSSFEEFMKQRRRWVLSDITNMLLVFKNIFKLARKNDSFSIAYILYMVQMFIIVILSPASTIIILAGGLNIAFGVPFEVVVPSIGVVVLSYALICLVCSLTVQVRCTLVLTLVMGAAMLSVVIGGSFYVIHDIMDTHQSGNFTFQQYYLILLLMATLLFAALIHPKECWLLIHGGAYVVGFPAIQILLPVYAVCNIVDQSWGTRDENKSNDSLLSCFPWKGCPIRKFSSSAEAGGHSQETGAEIFPENRFEDMRDSPQREEFLFWSRMLGLFLGKNTNLGVSGEKLAGGLRTLRIICLLALVIANTLWLALLSVLFFSRDVFVARVNVYGLIAGAVYGLVLLVQMVGMTVHRLQAIFTKFGLKVFGHCNPIWIYTRNGT